MDPGGMGPTSDERFDGELGWELPVGLLGHVDQRQPGRAGEPQGPETLPEPERHPGWHRQGSGLSRPPAEQNLRETGRLGRSYTHLLCQHQSAPPWCIGVHAQGIHQRMEEVRYEMVNLGPLANVKK